MNFYITYYIYINNIPHKRSITLQLDEPTPEKAEEKLRELIDPDDQIKVVSITAYHQNTTPCPHCHGTGKIPVQKIHEFSPPPDTERSAAAEKCPLSNPPRRRSVR